MIPAAGPRRLIALALLTPLGLFLGGCGDTITPETTNVADTPPEVIEPEGPDEPAAIPGEVGGPADDAFVGNTAVEAEPAQPSAGSEPGPEARGDEPDGTRTGTMPALVEPTTLASAATAPVADSSGDVAGNVQLVPMNYEEFLSRGATSPDARLTMVDAWATWCAPCKENFPHLVEMHEKYADQGLNTVSLAFDNPSDERALAEARRFLKEQGADFTNILLDEEFGVGFEKFDVNTIPAVFLYDPSGKEIRRFTWDDTDNQFTYDEVEQVVSTLLQDRPLPADAPGTVYTPRGAEDSSE